MGLLIGHKYLVRWHDGDGARGSGGVRRLCTSMTLLLFDCA